MANLIVYGYSGSRYVICYDNSKWKEIGIKEKFQFLMDYEVWKVIVKSVIFRVLVIDACVISGREKFMLASVLFSWLKINSFWYKRVE